MDFIFSMLNFSQKTKMFWPFSGASRARSDHSRYFCNIVIYEHSRSLCQNPEQPDHDHDRRSFCRSKMIIFHKKSCFAYFFLEWKKGIEILCNLKMKSSGLGKAVWSAIISRSLIKNVIYNHSQSWSPQLGKCDVKLIMMVIWLEMIGDHDPLDLARTREQIFSRGVRRSKKFF